MNNEYKFKYSKGAKVMGIHNVYNKYNLVCGTILGANPNSAINDFGKREHNYVIKGIMSEYSGNLDESEIVPFDKVKFKKLMLRWTKYQTSLNKTKFRFLKAMHTIKPKFKTDRLVIKFDNEQL